MAETVEEDLVVEQPGPPHPTTMAMRDTICGERDGGFPFPSPALKEMASGKLRLWSILVGLLAARGRALPCFWAVSFWGLHVLRSEGLESSFYIDTAKHCTKRERS